MFSLSRYKKSYQTLVEDKPEVRTVPLIVRTL